MKRDKRLPIEASLWTNTPRAFIFLVCRLIQRKSNKNLEYIDLIKFLGADFWDMEDFMETMIFPLKWLFQLAKTEEGRELLKVFNLPYNRSQLEELAEKIRIKDVIEAQSNISDEIISTPEVFLEKKGNPSAKFGSDDSSKKENAVADEIIVSLDSAARGNRKLLK